MRDEVGNITHEWTKALGFRISKEYLFSLLLEHPEYPSLLSISESLEQIGIKTAAVLTEEKYLHEIKEPFLLHTEENGGKFILIREYSKAAKNRSYLLNHWKGLILIADKKSFKDTPQNRFVLNRNTKRNRKLLAILFALVLFFAFSENNSLYTLLYFASSIIGILVSTYILNEELGIHNQEARKLCSWTSSTDCASIISSNSGLLNRIGITWADVGISYFGSVSLFCLIIQFYGNNTLPEFLAITSLASILFVAYSLIYQARKGKWCPLCILVQLILIIQFLILIPKVFNIDVLLLDATELLFYVSYMVMIAATWLLVIKPLIKAHLYYKYNYYSLSRFKFKPEIVQSYLEYQPRIVSSQFEPDLKLGNPRSKIQLIIASNPNCGPCSHLHLEMERFLSKYDIGITIRFAVESNNLSAKGVEAANHILCFLEENRYEALLTKRVLHDWYSSMDVNFIRSKYPLIKTCSRSATLALHDSWCREFLITATPTVFINLHKLPPEYTHSQLEKIIRALIIQHSSNEIEVAAEESNSIRDNLII